MEQKISYAPIQWCNIVASVVMLKCSAVRWVVNCMVYKGLCLQADISFNAYLVRFVQLYLNSQSRNIPALEEASLCYSIIIILSRGTR
jgi:hypothetical protein